MKILVTGAEGRIGRNLPPLLLEAGHEVRTLDLVAHKGKADWEHIPGDLCDPFTVRRALQGVDAVIHAGAVPFDIGDSTHLMQINVNGTWNVLNGAMESGIERVIYFSSINAQGSVKGHWPCEYLPIDDNYPHHPATPYQLSKHLGEEMCRSFSERWGMVTLCIRPVWVWDPELLGWFRGGGMNDFDEQWKNEYWAYVDMRDLCDATLRCVTFNDFAPGAVKHDAFLISADDTTSLVPSEELVQRAYPTTPWRKGERAEYFANNPHRSLIDCSHAKTTLGWQPKYSWKDEK
ncbi:MAG: NAD(P)-dependent oxidoreductase [Caldilineaceae bacterium]